MMNILSAYHPRLTKVLVYMLQQSEYSIRRYLKWLLRVDNFNHVVKRGKLDFTMAAKLLFVASCLIVVLNLAIAGCLIKTGFAGEMQVWQLGAGVFLLFAYPFVTALLLVVPALLGNWLIVAPQRRRQNLVAEEIFLKHSGTTIAVAGSFGKTTIKQILATVLGEGKKVASTEGNLNTAVAHYRFAKKLTGNEEIIIVEYGEYRPGDITEFNQVVQPNFGIITGLNEAHLENFKDLGQTAKNLLALEKYVGSAKTYVNAESPNLTQYAGAELPAYSQVSAGGWKITEIKVKSDGLEFKMHKGNQVINAKSRLLGRHNVGPLALAASLADQLGLNKKQIEAGLAKTEAYEHRLQPSQLAGGIMLIDDTYNGNIDGIKAGTALLGEIKAKRKIYITPGLVELGEESTKLHREMGHLIAPVADMVVLMKNSATDDIKIGLKSAGFKGEILEISEPLKFYQNLSHITVAGDVVMMQNDWSDSYS